MDPAKALLTQGALLGQPGQLIQALSDNSAQRTQNIADLAGYPPVYLGFCAEGSVCQPRQICVHQSANKGLPCVDPEPFKSTKLDTYLYGAKGGFLAT